MGNVYCGGYRRRIEPVDFNRALLVYIARLAIERNCARFEWSVLDWNTPVIRTYDKLNAKPMQDWILYRLTGAALVELAKEG